MLPFTVKELSRAIELRQLQMVYQPQYCCMQKTIGGLEALARWDKPGIGNIPPDLFITAAESNGLAEHLTRTVVESVVEDYRILSAHGFSVPVSINISAGDLKDGNFIPPFIRAMDFYKCDPSCFTFEITETAFVDDYKECVRNVALLKSIGSRISIDDFGTGHASCKYIKHFPADELKIDKQYIRDMADSVIDQTIVAFMIDLAHKLKCTVVAEGVETRAIADMVSEYGCDYIQGYWYARPMSIYDVVEFIDGHKTTSTTGAGR